MAMAARPAVCQKRVSSTEPGSNAANQATFDPMPRPPRLENPGGFFHLAACSFDGTLIYREARDRMAFLDLLQRTLETYRWQCQSYCLMGTHFHLIVQTMRPSLSRGMQALCGTYGLRFNKRHERKGKLFGRRFMGVRIESDQHLLKAHRYVARNPVRAGLCETPSEWGWSSYRQVLGLEIPRGFLDVNGIFRLFHDQPALGRDAFIRFVDDPRDKPLGDFKLAETDGV